MINNVVLVSGVQQSDSVIHIHVLKSFITTQEAGRSTPPFKLSVFPSELGPWPGLSSLLWVCFGISTGGQSLVGSRHTDI